MRAGSLANDDVVTRLRRNWLCTFTNIEGDPNAGGSFAHDASEPASPCLRGNGEHNMQVLFLTPDGHLLHVLAGYVPSADLVEALDFVHGLNDLVSHAKTKRAREFLVRDAHARRLRALDVDPNEPRTRPGGLDMLREAGQDGNGRDMLSRFKRMRAVTDLRYVHDHPLQHARSFRSEDLVGSGQSWFGASSSSSRDPRPSTPRGEIGTPHPRPPTGGRSMTPAQLRALVEELVRGARDRGVPFEVPPEGPDSPTTHAAK